MGASVSVPLRRKVTSQVITETLPANGSEGDASVLARYKGEFWGMLAGIAHDEWLAFGGGHMVRAYRADAAWKNSVSPVGNKLIEPFTEDTIREKWGGGRYNLWLYAPPDGVKLVGEPFHLELEGSPKIATGLPEQINGGTSGNSTDMLIRELLAEIRLSRGGTLAADSMKQAMDLNATALRTGVDAVRATLITPAATTAPSRMESLMEKFMEAMILKAMNPPETNALKDTLTLISDLKGSGLMGGPAKADLTSTLVSQLPMIADKFVAGLHEYRLQSEAAERTVRLQTGEMRPGDPRTITVDGKSEQPQTPAPATTAGAPQQIPPEQIAQIVASSHLHRLVAGIKQPDATGEDMYDYLRNAWPEILDELAQFTKEQLLMFFRSAEMQQQKLGNTILSEVGNDPRLPKMIEDFLAIAKKEAAAEATKATV